jgi:hypothetical protein
LTTDVSGTLPVANGGTGATTLTANNVLLGNGTAAPQFVAPGTSGNLLTSNGTTWTSAAPPASGFVTGMIMLWSGTIATIPSGWALCNGSNGTPDLRNKFVVGAYADDGGAAKTNVTGSYTQSGGSKDAIVVSHTHSATSTDSGHQHNQNTRSASFFGSSDGLAAGGSFSGQAELNVSGGRLTDSASANISTSISTTGSSGTNANLPPYFALAYIMKL